MSRKAMQQTEWCARLPNTPLHIMSTKSWPLKRISPQPWNLATGLAGLVWRGIHVDIIGQIGLKNGSVSEVLVCSHHRDLQTWSSCWFDLLRITDA